MHKARNEHLAEAVCDPIPPTLANMARDLQKLVWALIFVGTAHASSCPWTHAWEWQGVFHVHEGGMLVWSAEKNEKATYADQSMKMVIRTTSSATALGLEAAEDGGSQNYRTPQALRGTPLHIPICLHLLILNYMS